jgi:hypothetical protein
LLRALGLEPPQALLRVALQERVLRQPQVLRQVFPAP